MRNGIKGSSLCLTLSGGWGNRGARRSVDLFFNDQWRRGLEKDRRTAKYGRKRGRVKQKTQGEDREGEALGPPGVYQTAKPGSRFRFSHLSDTRPPLFVFRIWRLFLRERLLDREIITQSQLGDGGKDRPSKLTSSSPSKASSPSSTVASWYCSRQGTESFSGARGMKRHP